jgi:hypothetical protein
MLLDFELRLTFNRQHLAPRQALAGSAVRS